MLRFLHNIHLQGIRRGFAPPPDSGATEETSDPIRIYDSHTLPFRNKTIYPVPKLS